MPELVPSKERHVPDELADKSRWICYRIETRDEKTTKVPKAPRFHMGHGGLFNVSATSMKHTTTYSRALGFVAASRERLGDDGVDGVGFVLLPDDNIVGVDLDDCYDEETGVVDDVALEIVEQLDSYTELSPSGTGLHVLVRGELDDDYSNYGLDGVEIYSEDRFFTFTGRHVQGTPVTVESRPEAVRQVQQEHTPRVTTAPNTDGTVTATAKKSKMSLTDIGRQNVAQDTRRRKARARQRRIGTSSSTSASGSPYSKISGRTDGELIEIACSKDVQFNRLYDGHASGYGGDHSRADMALACKLAFWCEGDAEQMDRIFRQSGLMREKWDRKLGAGTYGSYTIQRAIERNDPLNG